MLNQIAMSSKKPKTTAPEASDQVELAHLSVKVVEHPADAAEQWEFLEKFANDPFSGYAWANAWYAAHENKEKYSPVIILGMGLKGTPLFLLPFLQQRNGPFNILIRPGRSHSAYSSGLFSSQCRQMIDSHNADAFWGKVFSVVPWADAIIIDGVRQAELVQRNPLRFLPLINSGNSSYEALLTPDWETFYNTKMNSKARSNIRRCENRLLEHGDLRFVIACNTKERLALLRVLLAQKAAQFKIRGIVNPYETDIITSFYETLVQCQDGKDSIVITAMVLDGKPLAVNLGIAQGPEFHGLIMSMAAGPLERFSPGRILLLRTIQHLFERGIGKFDFGVGKAIYKQGLIDNCIERYHVLAPMSVKGRLFVFGLRQAVAIKSLLKNSSWVKKTMTRAHWYYQKK